MPRRFIALAVIAPAIVAAQSAAPDPADSRAAVPPLRYESALAGTPKAEAKPAGWKAVNDEMARLGGHAGHLKGAAPAASPVTQPQGTRSRVPEDAKPAPPGEAHRH